jgi:membrane protease YdiL (CAAX protease family)
MEKPAQPDASPDFGILVFVFLVCIFGYFVMQAVLGPRGAAHPSPEGAAASLRAAFRRLPDRTFADVVYRRDPSGRWNAERAGDVWHVRDQVPFSALLPGLLASPGKDGAPVVAVEGKKGSFRLRGGLWTLDMGELPGPVLLAWIPDRRCYRVTGPAAEPWEVDPDPGVLYRTAGDLAGLVVAQVLFFVAFPFLLCRRWGRVARNVLLPLGIPLRAAVPALLLVPAAVFFVGIIESFLELHVYRFHEKVYTLYFETFDVHAIHPAWFLLSLAVMPAVCEEFFFRGFLQGTLAEKISGPFALLVSSLAFSLTHALPEILLPIFLLGFAFGALRLLTGSLLPCMGAHLLNNALGVTALLGGGAALEPLLAFTPVKFALSALLLAGAGWWAWKASQGTSEAGPELRDA